MASSKQKSKPTSSKALTSVKDGRISKSSPAAKAKGEKIAKKIIEEKTKKGESSSGSDSEDVTSSSSESSEDEKAAKTATTKANGALKTSGSVKKAITADSSDASSSDSDSESESESELKTLAKTNGATAKAKKAEGDSESDSDSASDNNDEKEAKQTFKADSPSSESSSDSDPEAEAPAKKPTDAKQPNGNLAKAKDDAAAADDSSSASSSDEDSSSESDDEDEEEESSPAKKRKAEAEAPTTTKKVKTDIATGNEGITNLFVGNLSWNVDEEWLGREFEQFGSITSTRVITERDSGRSKGFGYITFETHEAAAEALKQMQGSEIDGRKLNVDWSTPRDNATSPVQNRARANDRARKFGDQKNPPSATLFLGNLSFDITPEAVSEEFGQFGNITRVSLPTDRETGAIKGFGYVDYSTVEEAQAAMEAMSGAMLMGRSIRLDFGKPREDNGGGGRGGFGGGRGGFGGRGGSRGGGRGGRGGGRGGFSSTNRGGMGDFKGTKVSFD